VNIEAQYAVSVQDVLVTVSQDLVQSFQCVASQSIGYKQVKKSTMAVRRMLQAHEELVVAAESAARTTLIKFNKHTDAVAFKTTQS
jgi:hypothetical protein